jgi:hypothetical protein
MSVSEDQPCLARKNNNAMNRNTPLTLAAALCTLFCSGTAQAVTNIFFNGSQTATNVASGATSDTISSSGYLFTYSLDKWWYPTISLGPGTPTGRPQSITWPNGVGAQTLTAGPSGLLTTQVPATITVKRIDGKPFDLASFTAKILGNTAGAGASFEIMPVLNGIDGFADPLMFDATGIAGNTFSYSTPTLTGFDTYNISLWMDFGLTGLTLVDASLPEPPTLMISLTSSNYVRLYWPTQASGYSLQSSPDLTPGHFSNTVAVPVTEGAYQARYVPTTNSQRLFRLAQ